MRQNESYKARRRADEFGPHDGIARIDDDVAMHAGRENQCQAQRCQERRSPDIGPPKPASIRSHRVHHYPPVATPSRTFTPLWSEGWAMMFLSMYQACHVSGRPCIRPAMHQPGHASSSGLSDGCRITLRHRQPRSARWHEHCGISNPMEKRSVDIVRVLFGDETLVTTCSEQRGRSARPLCPEVRSTASSPPSQARRCSSGG
jgi:hypothetical protein